MSNRAPHYYLALILGLGGPGMCQISFASEFQMRSDFLDPQLRVGENKKGISISALRLLPPQNLSQLLAAAGSARKSIPQHLPNQGTPQIYVQSPLTGGRLQAVAAPRVLAGVSEDEILAEAKRLLEVELPQPRKITEAGFEEVQKPLLGEKKSILAERLVLRARGDQLEISPESLNLILGSEAVEVVFDAGLSQQPQLFLREGKILHLDATRQLLSPRGVGRSEIFITYRNQMYILPVEVVKPSRAPLLGDNQRSLEYLTSVLSQGKNETYTYQSGLPAAANQETRPLSLANSVAEVDATAAFTAAKSRQFVYTDANPDFRTIAVQIVDERSIPEQSLLYPVGGVNVRLHGTEIVARSDAKGHALFGDIPSGARFWVSVQDEKGEIVPTVSELSLPRGSKREVLRARTMTYRSFFAYQSILEVVQDTQLGSICARAMDSDGRQPQAGIQVGLNVEADGPFYVGQFGPQRELKSTEQNGRFCFFNVKPGLVEMSFYRGSQYLTALALPVFAGAHSEEDLPLENSGGRRLLLAALPNAMQQIYEELEPHDLFQPVDAIDMLAIGENESLTRLSPHVLGHEGGFSDFKGRLYGLAQAPEFENVLYSFDKDKEISRHMPVVPLFQRGFIEDLFHELNMQDNRESIAFDPALGQALVYHTLEGDSPAPVKISLIDSGGQVRDDAWYFGSPNQGQSKVVFFNLQPGVYQVKVENAQGAIIALDTLGVDFWTTAFVQTGSSVQFSLAYRREDEGEGE